MSKTDMTNSALTEKFDALFPCGHTNFYKMEPSPIHIFQSRAEGGRFWDVEGREYIDYMGCLGASILGHRHPDYMRSLQSYTEQHSVCSASGICYSEDDITVAEALVKHVPCAEQVKFGVTGSDAVQLAFRLARAHTGKPYSLRFRRTLSRLGR